MSKDRIPILGPNLTAFEPLIFALALAALSLAFRRTFSTTPIAKQWYIYWTATNRCAAIGIKKKSRIKGTLKSRVFHSLSRCFHGFFTHFSHFGSAPVFFVNGSVEIVSYDTLLQTFAAFELDTNTSIFDNSVEN